jgi:VanZ family protein
MALLLWVAAFLYLTLTPNLPRFGSVDVDDYGSWGHVIGSMGVAAILYLLAIDYRGWSRVRAAVTVVVVVSSLGVAIELAQAIFGDRDASVSDACFDVLGAVLAVVVLAVVVRRPRAVTSIVVTLSVVFAGLTVVSAAFFTSDRPIGACETSVLTRRAPSTSLPSAQGRRTTRGLVALYVPGPDPATVENLRGYHAETDLHVSPTGVAVTDEGLQFSGGLARTRGAAAVLTDAILDRDALTIEVWARSTDLDQGGPTRIVTISDGDQTDQVNVHLGQERDALSVRLRADCGDFNTTAVPGVFASRRRWEHLAVTYSNGVQRVYVQGRLVDARRFSGRLEGWDREYPLALGNETTRNRPFAGDVASAAVYDRALSPREIAAAAAEGRP